MSDRSVDLSDGTGGVDVDLMAQLEAVAHWVLEQERVATAELSVALVSDNTIAELNQQYLSHSGPTDVISFPLDGISGQIVGDVYIGVEQARRQAAEVGVEVAEELLRLTIHGVLHVLGRDHPDDAADRPESPMYRRQEELLASFLEQER